MRILSLLLSIILSGCTHVSPWERGTLAKPEMALVYDPLSSMIMTHTYSSKEAAAGGYGVGGGGCGCN
jgi:hypothetical protein